MDGLSEDCNDCSRKVIWTLLTLRLMNLNARRVGDRTPERVHSKPDEGRCPMVRVETECWPRRVERVGGDVV
jgi:hypothetical protein